MSETSTSIEVAARLRISYRQLDHWIERGYLPIADDHPGQGSRRRFTEAEAERASILAALVHAGFNLRPAAEAVAAGYVLTPSGQFLISSGTAWICGSLP